jgi:hypothetical protein
MGQIGNNMSEEKTKLKQEILKLNENIQEIVSKIEIMGEAAKSTRPEQKTLEEFVECVKEFRKLQDEKDVKQEKLDNETSI